MNGIDGIDSYPKVWSIGPRHQDALFDGVVVVQEKIDGSQFSAMKDGNGDLHFMSKKAVVYPQVTMGLFKGVVGTFQTLVDDLRPGWVYRGESVQRPQHNVIKYDRVPKGNFVLFDVQIGPNTFLEPEDLQKEADRLGLECAPLLYHGEAEGPEQFMHFLEKESFLGGMIEGVVIKNYAKIDPILLKILMCKVVQSRFKEVHKTYWKKSNPTRKDVVQALIEAYGTVSRYDKAVVHLEEDGKREGTLRDIGNLIQYVQQDVEEECKQEIMEALWNHFWSDIRRGIVRGVPNYYKERLRTEQ